MGVYLPNVDMPKDDKVVTVQICPDGSIWQQYRGTVPNAKAVPVPPHGLIAREQILDAIRLELEQANACNDMDDYDAWMRVFDYVRKFPTIIPASEEGE